MLTFKAFLLSRFGERDGSGLPTRAGEIALQLTTEKTTVAIDGGALRDHLIREDSELKNWLWEQWRLFGIWRANVQCLPAEQPLPLVVHESADFCTMKFPPRLTIAKLTGTDTVVFSQRSLNQIFAFRGVGKTMLALALAGCLASGGELLHWTATRRSRVMYVEGEMANEELQQRAMRFTKNVERGFLRLITLESQENGIPSLSSAAGRQAVEEALGDTEVLILDSISTLAWMSTNDEENWLDLLNWLNRLRARGLCVIFLHHAGKAGTQRGHSRSEDLLNISIKLTRRPEDAEAEFLKFLLEYDKFRGDRTGVRSLVVEYRNEKWNWAWAEVDKLAQLNAYLAQNPGASSRRIARDVPDLGNHTTVQRLLKTLRETPAVQSTQGNLGM